MSLLRRLSAEEADSCRRNAFKHLLSHPTAFDLQALRLRGWVAAPFRDHISPETARSLAKAAAALGESSANCVTTEKKVNTEGYELALTERALLEFDANLLLRAFIIMPKRMRFALLEHGDYFYVIAGPKQFVEVVGGNDLAEIRQEFLRYAREIPENDATKAWLEATVTRYLPGCR